MSSVRVTWPEILRVVCLCAYKLPLEPSAKTVSWLMDFREVWCNQLWQWLEEGCRTPAREVCVRVSLWTSWERVCLVLVFIDHNVLRGSKIYSRVQSHTLICSHAEERCLETKEEKKWERHTERDPQSPVKGEDTGFKDSESFSLCRKSASVWEQTVCCCSLIEQKQICPKSTFSADGVTASVRPYVQRQHLHASTSAPTLKIPNTGSRHCLRAWNDCTRW